MRKELLFVVLLAGTLVAAAPAKAQPKAIGARFGWTTEVSYQHTFGPGFFEVGFGVPGYRAGIALDGVYNWVAYRNTSSKRNCFEFFLGGGLGLHTFFYKGNPSYDIYGNYVAGSGTYTRVGFGVMGSIGVQYQFSIPLQIGVSWRPIFGGLFGNGYSGFYVPGLYDGGLAIRYVF